MFRCVNLVSGFVVGLLTIISLVNEGKASGKQPAGELKQAEKDTDGSAETTASILASFGFGSFSFQQGAGLAKLYICSIARHFYIHLTPLKLLPPLEC